MKCTTARVQVKVDAPLRGGEEIESACRRLLQHLFPERDESEHARAAGSLARDLRESADRSIPRLKLAR